MAKIAAVATNALHVRMGRIDALPFQDVFPRVLTTQSVETTNSVSTESAKRRLPLKPLMTMVVLEMPIARTHSIVLTVNAATMMAPAICAVEERETNRVSSALNATKRRLDAFPSRTVTHRPALRMPIANGTKSATKAIALCVRFVAVLLPSVHTL